MALAEAGASIALSDRDAAGLAAAASEVAAACAVDVSIHPCDLAQEIEVRSLPEKVAAHHGGLDILVNNAAYVGTTAVEGWAVPFEAQSSEAWRKAMEVNATAPFELVQSALPLLKQSGNGSIINIASIYGILGPDWSLYDGTTMANPAGYAASKGALVQLSRWLATTVGPSVRVNSISPGGIARGQPPSFVSRYVERTPLKRMATESDFKGIILFLASDLSRYVTGQNIIVDGGWSAW